MMLRWLWDHRWKNVPNDRAGICYTAFVAQRTLLLWESIVTKALGIVSWCFGLFKNFLMLSENYWFYENWSQLAIQVFFKVAVSSKLLISFFVMMLWKCLNSLSNFCVFLKRFFRCTMFSVMQSIGLILHFKYDNGSIGLKLPVRKVIANAVTVHRLRHLCAGPCGSLCLVVEYVFAPAFKNFII